MRHQQLAALLRVCPQLTSILSRTYQTAVMLDVAQTVQEPWRRVFTPSNAIPRAVNVPHAPPLHSRWDQLPYPQVQALLVDAAGVLLHPSEPAAEVYLRYGKKYGVTLDPREVLMRYREAYNTPWGDTPIRYVGDARPFWRRIVAESTGCDNEAMFEEIYEYYARGEAWFVPQGAVESLRRIRNNMHMRTAVVSNFDTRLRGILKDLQVEELFDAVIISAEVGAEKPNPRLFEAACDALGVPPETALHIGDDRRNDLFGARDAGCFAWLWGADVHNFAEVERRLESGNMFDSLSGV